ncbi:MAG: adenylate/guanylate cyclase domain-containing protein [Candidatus Latescibacteria bacterium]|nr:adenylate/guanylate cyclase domain-containing protein [Candidatus Latescibacterota bacterium]
MTQIVSILFADVVGYSKLEGDGLAVRVAEFIDDFLLRDLTPANHFLQKTWGDGLLIASYDPVDIAEIALALRDRFRNAQWKRLGFSSPLSVRIATHAERVQIRMRDGEPVDIVGGNVNSAARIEPVVEPGCIFCSELFHQHLKNTPQVEYGWRPLGVRPLAKGFGKMALFELLRVHETSISPESGSERPVPAFEIPQPRIPREFTDRERDDYLVESFKVIADYFGEAASQLKSAASNIDVRFSSDSSQVECVVYLGGRERTRCRIWIGQELQSRSILFSEGQPVGSNSYNEYINVVDDRFQLSLRMMMGMMGISVLGRNEKPATPAEVAKALWVRFTRILEQ